MKYTINISLFLIIFSSTLSAQMPDFSDEVKKAMSQLSVMEGNWEGEGVRQNPDGTEAKSFVTENLYYKLDDTIMILEGLGKDENGEVVHNALALIAYNPQTDKYEMRSHLSTGRATEASFEVIEPNKSFMWGFNVPNGGKIKYNLEFEKNSWFETGHYSRDGENWMQFFEMNLTRVQ